MSAERVASQVFDAALVDSELSEVAIAETAGVNRKSLRRWRSPLERATVPLSVLSRLPREVQRRVLEAMAASIGYGLAELPACVDVTSDIQRTARLAQESGECLAAWADAMADGSLTAAESDRVEREADDLIRAALSIKARCRVARRERVVGVQL